MNLTVTGPDGQDTATQIVHVYSPLVGLRVYTNGVEADAPPGPSVPAGSTVTWTCVVTNTGGGLHPISFEVTDDRIGTVPDPVGELLWYNESRILTATGTAAAGQYANNVTVSAVLPGLGGAGSATASSHYYGVAVLAVPPSTRPPTDTDGDGVYDDVNDNGRKDFSDVVLYFNQMTWIAAHEPTALFDCNANGRIDFVDVVWLFSHLQAPCLSAGRAPGRARSPRSGEAGTMHFARGGRG